MAGAVSKQDRFTLIDLGARENRSAFAADVRAGLLRPAGSKRLSCKYFYDGEGSELFEEICTLEEYYLPRAEREILEARAKELASMLAPRTSVIELGSGSSTKTRILLDAILSHLSHLSHLERGEHLAYLPVDVSKQMLEESSLALVRDYPRLEVTAIAAEYEAGLAKLAQMQLGPKLFLWLGSNIGNFDRQGAADFLRLVKTAAGSGDRILVGIDLRKDAGVLQRAYDDSRGITAAFNKNILARVNRELGGDFDLAAFDHRALYDGEAGRIEMYLVSKGAQSVRVRELELAIGFEAGEAVHTEDSYKYSREEIRALADAAGLSIERQWLDLEGRFSETLLAF